MISALGLDILGALIIFQEHFVRETGRRAQGQIAACLSAEDLFGLQS